MAFRRLFFFYFLFFFLGWLGWLGWLDTYFIVVDFRNARINL